MVKTGAASLEAAVKRLLRDYVDEVDESLKRDLRHAGEVAAIEVSKGAKSRFGGTGKYASGWDYSFSARGGVLTAVVHNTSQPSLTHLLEKGHMNRDGGWTPGHEHIEPAYEKGRQVLERSLANG